MTKYKKKPWQHLYNTKAWKQLRRAQLDKQPLCVMCRDKFKRVRPANVADHIKRHQGDESLFFNANNLQSLCRSCHDVHKQRQERGFVERKEFGSDGYPIG